MKRKHVLFCVGSLALSLLIAVLAYPYAAISEARLQASRQVVPAENMGAVNLGEFGKVSVQELVDYYLENPPVKAAVGAPAHKVRFGGC